MTKRIVATAAMLLLATVQNSAAEERRFLQHWQGPTATGTGWITMDLDKVLNPGNSTHGFDNEGFVTDFELKVSGAYAGNGIFPLSDFDGSDVLTGPGHIGLDTGDTALDFSRELVGQPTSGTTWGDLDEDNGSFLLFRDFGTLAPSVAGSFAIVTAYGTDMLALKSLRPALCGDAPVVGGCRAGFGSRLVLKDSETADSLKWQWTGDGFEQADLGNPATADTYYSLCIYDETAGLSSLASEIGLDRGEGWSDESPRGLEYVNTGESFGVTRARIRIASDGATSVKLQAGTEVLRLPDPVGAEFFDQDSHVTVQLVSSEGACWSSSFAAGDTTRNSVKGFRARQ